MTFPTTAPPARRAGAMLLLIASVWAGPAGAQHPAPGTHGEHGGDAEIEASSVLDEAPPSRCEGCPARNVGRAFLDELVVNTIYGSINLARGQVTGRITPKSWWANMRQGWEWDLDDFQVNQFGHPYQGNNYFNAGRGHGLSFWESAALTAFGSATWEYFGETNRASLNDLMNTTMGGIALGETLHRMAWLVRDPATTGRKRTAREAAALLVDPVTSLQRMISGEAWQEGGVRPTDAVPASLSVSAVTGVLWRSSNQRELSSTTNPFLELNLIYGDAIARTRRPYDHFEMRFDFGGGAGLSEIRVRGDLMSRRLAGRTRVSVMQNYQYAANAVYRFGSQSVLTGVSYERPIARSRFSWVAAGAAGLTPLGAVDSLPAGMVVAPPPVVNPGAGQGVSTGPRNYDYGPGTSFGGHVLVRHDDRALVTMSYEAQHLYTTDGIRANHLLQRVRLFLNAPLKGRLGLGAGVEYFDRRTFYQSDAPDARFHFPQFRATMTWEGR